MYINFRVAFSSLPCFCLCLCPQPFVDVCMCWSLRRSLILGAAGAVVVLTRAWGRNFFFSILIFLLLISFCFVLLLPLSHIASACGGSRFSPGSVASIFWLSGNSLW